MAKNPNENGTNLGSYRPEQQSVTIGKAQIRLIRTPSPKDRTYRVSKSGETTFVPGGSYKPERFPELEQLKREFFDIQTVES